MTKHGIDITLAPLGEPVNGGWCEACALPSVATIQFVVSSDRATIGRGALSICTECDLRTPGEITEP